MKHMRPNSRDVLPSLSFRARIDESTESPAPNSFAKPPFGTFAATSDKLDAIDGPCADDGADAGRAGDFLQRTWDLLNRSDSMAGLMAACLRAPGVRLAAAPARSAATLHFKQTLMIVPDGSGPTGEPQRAHEKVLMRVAVSDLRLTDAQAERLAHVAGPRLNASTGMLTLVGRVHETAEENKAVVRAQLRLLIEDALENAGSTAPVQDPSLAAGPADTGGAAGAMNSPLSA